MFEPIHGSAPKYKGMNLVNPVATILAARMMLDWLGEVDAADLIARAVDGVLADGRVKTKDLGGRSSTTDMGDAVCERILALAMR
jgi:isocitrate/isopropylmalate dehydrogenase